MPDTDKVVVAYCHPGHVTAHFHESLLNLIVADAAGPRRIVDGGGRLGYQSSANISDARNEAVRTFLTGDADWLFIIDTDMVFDPDTLERLLDSAKTANAPIMGGLCFGIEDGLLFPTLYDLGGTVEQVEFLRYTSYPDGVLQVFGTGAACLLVHREVFEKIAAQPPSGLFSAVFPWFQEREFSGASMGEDLCFCLRANTLGIPVMVDTTVKVGHVKTHVLIAEQFLAQRQMIRDMEQEAEVAAQ